jgi:hypothetical protein
MLHSGSGIEPAGRIALCRDARIPPTNSRRIDMSEYAGRSQDERVSQRKHEKQRAQEPPGGDMAVHGTEPDASHSSGELSQRGKDVWRKGAGIDGGGKSG